MLTKEADVHALYGPLFEAACEEMTKEALSMKLLRRASALASSRSKALHEALENLPLTASFEEKNRLSRASLSRLKQSSKFSGGHDIFGQPIPHERNPFMNPGPKLRRPVTAQEVRDTERMYIPHALP